MSLDQALRYLLPAYLALYFATAFFGQSYLAWKRTGINPYVLKVSDDAYGLVGRLMKWVSGAGGAAILIYVFWPAGYGYLVPIPWLQHDMAVYIGVFLLFGSLGWILIAQHTMGDSWRIGIDTEQKTDLVHRGVYRYSRNPIFLGMRATVLGLFLVLPNALTLVVLTLSDVLIQIQVRLEEAHLESLHGEAYRDYKAEVRRWL